MLGFMSIMCLFGRNLIGYGTLCTRFFSTISYQTNCLSNSSGLLLPSLNTRLIFISNFKFDLHFVQEGVLDKNVKFSWDGLVCSWSWVSFPPLLTQLSTGWKEGGGSKYQGGLYTNKLSEWLLYLRINVFGWKTLTNKARKSKCKYRGECIMKRRKIFTHTKCAVDLKETDNSPKTVIF